MGGAISIHSSDLGGSPIPSQLSYLPPAVSLFPLSSENLAGDSQLPLGSVCTPLSWPSPQLPMHGMSSDPSNAMLFQQMTDMQSQIASLVKTMTRKDRLSRHKGASCSSEQ